MKIASLGNMGVVPAMDSFEQILDSGPVLKPEVPEVVAPDEQKPEDQDVLTKKTKDTVLALADFIKQKIKKHKKKRPIKRQIKYYLRVMEFEQELADRGKNLNCVG